ncbi:uncharacterized protein LOC129762467 isoform X1 [Toxorhynchites rutilus septentrionalis]|uniref:uncharacterized protein LOC129762467 isoform X1 n=1 Tax=Toxorhynchites rutilus septentrionalis TaxID=329112 RepID=UPI002479335A|nr:uncharacterized protein LOC129762467 isoform X1 [Toxorhynchites rutilus septentrionalis]
MSTPFNFAQMIFARTRANAFLVRFCANVVQIRVTNKAMVRIRRFLSEVTIISLLSGTWMCMLSACFLCVHCAPLNHLGQPLFENATLWLNPCNVHSYSYNTNKTKTITPAQRLDNLDRIKSSITRTIQEIDQITSLSGNTDWNTAQNRKKYMFLQPYKKNQTTWEPRLQTYLASIQVIYQKQVELEKAKNIHKHQSPKLQELRQNAKGLLCEIQEYRNNSKIAGEFKSYGISVVEMNSIIKFDMTEEANMELHKWFLKCRFRCFLEDMEQHINNLVTKFSRAKQKPKHPTTKKPKRKLKKGHKNVRKNERPLNNKCCIVNNKPTRPATPRPPPMDGTYKVNKKKLNASQQSKLIKPNQKKVQRKGNKNSA